jgi:tRNA(adenine34) deaminase
MTQQVDRQDYICMGMALDQARAAGGQGEVPVGALLTDAGGRVIAAAGNNCIGLHDPTGHAEMHVLRAAATALGNYRLPGTTMYVTLEPCAMCAAAMVNARVTRVVFGAADPKAGGLVSVYGIGTDGRLNHGFDVTGGIRAEECRSLLREFFKKRR